MRTLMFVAVLLAGGSGRAQDAPEPVEQLGRLRATALALQRDLPNISCHQAAVSERLRGEKTKKRVEFEADLTVVRTPRGELSERSRITVVDGKPWTKTSLKMPLFLVGGVDEAFIFFLPRFQQCFVFRGDARRIDWVSVDAISEDACNVGRGSVGFALLDEAGTVTHLERRTPADAAVRTHVSAFSAYDLKLTTLGNKTYPLSTRVTADIPDGKDTRRFTSEYSDCRLYQGSVTIVPGVTVVPDEAPPEPHP